VSDYSLELYKASGDPYVFDYTPGVAINFEMYYNKSTEPPTVAGVGEIWDVDEATFINNDADALATAFDAFIAFLTSRSAPVIGIRLKRGSTTIHHMDTTSHRRLMFSNIQMAKTPARHANHVVMSFRATGVDGRDGTETGEGGTADDQATVTQLEKKLSFSYNRGGFLTKTLTGVVRTKNSGAEAAARRLGKLVLPSNKFRYATNGPEGVDVVVESYPADNQASFTCTIVEQALDFPQENVYVFRKNVQTKSTRFADYYVTTITAQAGSVGAADFAAQNAGPSNVEGQEKSVDEDTNTVTYTFYSKAPKSTFLSKEYEFKITGGGRPRIAIPVMYGYPVMGAGPLQPSVVEEVAKVRALKGSASLLNATATFSQAALDEPSTVFEIRRVKVSADSLNAAQDEYESVLSRKYVFDRAPTTFNATVLAKFNEVG